MKGFDKDLDCSNVTGETKGRDRVKLSLRFLSSSGDWGTDETLNSLEYVL